MRSFSDTQAKVPFWLFALNGFLLGTFITCTAFKSGKVIVLATLLFIGFAALNLGRRGFATLSADWLSKKTWIGTALILFNLLVIAAEHSREVGMGFAVKEAILEGQLLLLLGILGSRHGLGSPAPFLITLSIAFVWFGVGNFLADQLGLDPGIFDERRGIYQSRFEEGESRWIAPFYSSAQLSSLLRWALPVLAFWISGRQMGWAQRLFAGGIALVLIYLLRIIEFRAAAFPMLGFMLWRLIPTYRFRGILNGLFVSYMFVAPLIFTNSTFRNLLEQAVPDFVLRMAGKQDVTGLVSLTDRTEIWDAGIDSLREGNYLFYGKGHVFLDAYSQTSFADPLAGQVGGRIAFHQGFLDLIFIYGLIPALLLSSVILVLTWRGVGLLSRKDLNDEQKQRIEWALFGLGMLGLSNMHDGFFNVHQFFYVIAVVCFVTLRMFSKIEPSGSPARGRAEKGGVAPSPLLQR